MLMSMFHLIFKPSFFIGFCLVFAVKIGNMCILSWNPYSLVFPVNCCPKQFQKQWQIQLHDICSSLFPCFLQLPSGCVSVCQQCQGTSWPTSFSFEWDLNDFSNFLTFYFHNFTLQSGAFRSPPKLISPHAGVQHQPCAPIRVPGGTSKACAPPPGSAQRCRRAAARCCGRHCPGLGVSAARTLQKSHPSWLLK